MKTSIRTATTQDLHQIIELGKELYLIEKRFEPHLIFSELEARSRYEFELKNSDALVLVAEFDDRIVGYLYAHNDAVDYLDVLQKECEIEVIFVEPEYRGQGIASQLIEKGLVWAKSKNVFRVKSGILVGNHCSDALFAKFKFKPYHTTYTFDS